MTILVEDVETDIKSTQNITTGLTVTLVVINEPEIKLPQQYFCNTFPLIVIVFSCY